MVDSSRRHQGFSTPDRRNCGYVIVVAPLSMPCPAAREPLPCGRPMMPAQDPQPPERGGHCGLPVRPGTSAASVPASVPLRPGSPALHILAGTSATSVPPFRARSLTIVPLCSQPVCCRPVHAHSVSNEIGHRRIAKRRPSRDPSVSGFLPHPPLFPGRHRQPALPPSLPQRPPLPPRKGARSWHVAGT